MVMGEIELNTSFFKSIIIGINCIYMYSAFYCEHATNLYSLCWASEHVFCLI